MRFSSERELQDYCLQVLESKGITAYEEVWCGQVRADIVTDRAVMELKKRLDRNAIYQAYGQAMVYQKFLNKAEIWIVGQTPTDPSERATAFTVAKEIASSIVKVSFIESDPFWQRSSIALPSRFTVFNRFSLSRQSVAILALISIAFLSSTFGLSRTRSSVAQNANSTSEVAVISTPPGGSKALAPALPRPAPAAASFVEPGLLSTRRLSRCGNGSLANFRRSPSLADRSVFGVLQVGDPVQPTGRITQEDGVEWVEAIAPDLYPNQVGWIASCFFKG